jgi:tripeptidyl-peptidase I
MANMKFYLVAVVVLLGLVESIAIPPHVKIHEKRHSLNPRWTKRDRVESYKVLQMRVGLAQTNLDDGYEHLMDV